MVLQGIRDRSTIRRHKVTEKQESGDEGEMREAREGNQGRTWRRVSVGRRGDPGEIQGRSIDLWEYGVQECRRMRRRVERQGQQGVSRVRGIKGGQ